MLTAPTTLFRRAPWALIIRAEPFFGFVLVYFSTKLIYVNRKVDNKMIAKIAQ
jgi:hypothetical protein